MPVTCCSSGKVAVALGLRTTYRSPWNEANKVAGLSLSCQRLPVCCEVAVPTVRGVGSESTEPQVPAAAAPLTACLTLLLGFRSFAEPVQHCIEAQKRLARCSVRCQVSRCLTIEGPSCDRSVRGLPPTLRRYMRAYRCHARWPSVTQTNIPFPVCLSNQNPT